MTDFVILAVVRGTHHLLEEGIVKDYRIFVYDLFVVSAEQSLKKESERDKRKTLNVAICLEVFSDISGLNLIVYFHDALSMRLRVFVLAMRYERVAPHIHPLWFLCRCCISMEIASLLAFE